MAHNLHTAGAAAGLEGSHGFAHLRPGGCRQAGAVTGEIDDRGGGNPAIVGRRHPGRSAGHGVQIGDHIARHGGTAHAAVPAPLARHQGHSRHGGLAGAGGTGQSGGLAIVRQDRRRHPLVHRGIERRRTGGPKAQLRVCRIDHGHAAARGHRHGGNGRFCAGRSGNGGAGRGRSRNGAGFGRRSRSPTRRARRGRRHGSVGIGGRCRRVGRLGR